MLHPNKNKFVEDEAAFKLVAKANRVLSDMGSVPYMTCRVSLRTAAPKPPPYLQNKQHVSYDECISDGDFVSPQKRSRLSGLLSTDKEIKEAARISGVSKTGNPTNTIDDMDVFKS